MIDNRALFIYAKYFITFEEVIIGDQLISFETAHYNFKNFKSNKLASLFRKTQLYGY